MTFVLRFLFIVLIIQAFRGHCEVRKKEGSDLVFAVVHTNEVESG